MYIRTCVFVVCMCACVCTYVHACEVEYIYTYVRIFVCMGDAPLPPPVQVVHLLLKSGQCQPRPGVLQTPLHIAAKHGQVECLRLLIQYGYPVDTKGMSGTSLHEAALYGKVEVVRFLLEAGADVTALNGQGLTPLDVVNQYTDPRSSQELKRALQGEVALSVMVRYSLVIGACTYVPLLCSTRIVHTCKPAKLSFVTV